MGQPQSRGTLTASELPSRVCGDWCIPIVIDRAEGLMKKRSGQPGLCAGMFRHTALANKVGTTPPAVDFSRQVPIAGVTIVEPAAPARAAWLKPRFPQQER